MHFTAEQILWALVLAGHLILLIVLLGRDRIHRFRWFTAAIALSAVILLADHLLSGKLPQLIFYWQSFATIALESIFALFVLIELARRVFSARRIGPGVEAVPALRANGWLGWGLLTVLIAAGILWAWGPWPTLAQLNAQPSIRNLLILQLVATKSELFVDMLTVEVALLLLIFGRRFGSGLRSHAQLIAIGLSTNALCFLVLQVITGIIRRSLHFTSREEANAVIHRLEHLFANLDNARFALWVLALIWWIYWLWRDEPGEKIAVLATSDAPVLANSPELPGVEAQVNVEEVEEAGDADFRESGNSL